MVKSERVGRLQARGLRDMEDVRPMDTLDADSRKKFADAEVG